MTKCTIEKIRGTEVLMRLPSDLNEYALNFLALFNNYRTNKDIHYLSNNDSDNAVIIVAYEKESESYSFFREWLMNFGTIIREDKVNIYVPYIDDDKINDDIDNLVSCELSRKGEWY